METVPPAFTAFVAGIFLAIGWLLILLAAHLWAVAWAWIDDSERSRTNPVTRRVMALLGYHPTEYKYSEFAYRHSKTNGISDGLRAVFLPAMALFCVPFSILYYPVAIGLLTAFALAHIARFARRHKKLFDQHLKDPGAHKESR